eukprot:3511639-Pyramimonas_sp.AAC.1
MASIPATPCSLVRPRQRAVRRASRPPPVHVYGSRALPNACQIQLRGPSRARAQEWIPIPP